MPNTLSTESRPSRITRPAMTDRPASSSCERHQTTMRIAPTCRMAQGDRRLDFSRGGQNGLDEFVRNVAGSSSLKSPQAILPALIVIWYWTRYSWQLPHLLRWNSKCSRRSDGEIAADVVEEEFREFPALHDAAPPKWGASMVRNAWRARCSRIFAALTDSPSILAVSSVSRPSMSRSTRTVR